MKTLITTLKIAIFACVLTSCSTEDNVPLETCEGNSVEINARFDGQIAWVMENTNPIDYRTIELMNEERATALANACE